MRVAALGFVVLIALSGCDQLGVGQRTAQVPAAPCHCAPAEHMVRLTPPAPERHHHHHGASSHSYSQGWAGRYEEEESSSYTSESRSYTEGDEGSASAGHRDTWVDGYGREHYAGAHVTRVAADDHDRRDPYHAYKSKCGDKEQE